MSPNESEKKIKQKLENDIKNYENALEIINDMMRIIRNFKNRNHFQNEDYEEDMDEKHLLTVGDGFDDSIR